MVKLATASRTSTTIAIVSLCFLLSGCAKKAVQTTPAPPAPAEVEAPAPGPTPTPPEPKPVAAPTPDPLAGDLESVNRYVRDQGLIDDVYYDYDRSDLREEARSRLQKNAEFMKQHPQFVFTLEGHCDERGTVEYNLALGQRRASSAQGYLSSLGVPGQQMRTVSYGRERPVCTDSHEDCWWKNRRTHFVITGRQ
jgi:peptidoglycan-associated lipoprotein